MNHKKKIVLTFTVIVALAAVLFLANEAWERYDYQQRTTDLFQKLKHSWSQVDIQSALDRHATEAQAGWRMEAVDTLIVIREKVQSVLEQDEEWTRKQEWFDYWLEQNRPEPEIRWAISMASWASELITALDSGVNPFSEYRAGDYLRVFRVDGNREPYRIYLPESLDAGGRYPVVVGFHSREGNEDLFFHAFDGERLKKAVREAGFVFVGTTQGGLLGRCVKPKSKNTVKTLVAVLSEQHFVDSDNIFFLGHSRGSPAAVHCGADDPGTARAIAIMAPSMSPKEFSEGAFFKNTPFIIVTASRDEHYRSNGEAMYRFIADQGGKEVKYLVVPDEDHFFTRGADHYQLFKQVFDFFARHRSSESGFTTSQL